MLSHRRNKNALFFAEHERADQGKLPCVPKQKAPVFLSKKLATKQLPVVVMAATETHLHEGWIEKKS